MAANTLRELFAYNRWANDRLLAAAAQLDDARLDQRFDMGPGSIRETLKHIYGAERIWYERVDGPGWKYLPQGAPVQSLIELREAMHRLHDARDAWMAELSVAGLERSVSYRDMKGNPHVNRLCDILAHVGNHGVHHRAQVGAMLTRVGRRTQNFDLCFMRVERPTAQVADEKTADRLSAAGLTVGREAAEPPAMELSPLRHYFRYADWANEKILAAAEPLDDAALDRPLELGLGTLRRTVLHVEGAERNWLENWMQGSKPGFLVRPETIGIAELRAKWRDTARIRNAFLATLDDAALLREILAQPEEGIRLHYRLGAIMLHVNTHGTHHRAQALNMLRQLGAAVPGLDYILWCREKAE